jgi:hypothetical protein
MWIAFAVLLLLLLLLMLAGMYCCWCLLQSAVPVAAWLPHQRQATAAAIQRCHHDLAMPVAVLALGWGSRLVLFEVPLLGDHVSLGGMEADLGPAAAAGAAAAAAAAAGEGCHSSPDLRQPPDVFNVCREAGRPTNTCFWYGDELVCSLIP